MRDSTSAMKRSPVVVVALVAVLIALVVLGNAVDSARRAADRAARSEILDGITTATVVHVAPDGRLVVTEAGNSPELGRVVLVDTSSGRRDIPLDGLRDPSAADAAADGTVCAAIRDWEDGTSQFWCSDGRRLALPDVARDVLWDGGAGWLVSIPRQHEILWVVGSDISVAASFTPDYVQPMEPGAMARTEDGRLLAAFSDQGVRVVLPLDRAREEPVPAAFPFIAGIVPRGLSTIVLVAEGNGVVRVGACCGGAESDILRTIVDGFAAPHGLALLPDGRLAISADTRVTLYRPEWLPPG